MNLQNAISIIKVCTPILIALAAEAVPMFAIIKKLINSEKCQLRSTMLRIYYHNKDDEKIRQYELENFIFLYDAYKALKGNSFIDKIHEEIMSWEVIS